MSKYNVHNRAVASLVSSGAIGAPHSMTAVFLGYRDDREDSWRTRRADSGLGCLGDLAIYPVTTAIDLFGSFPATCEATAYPASDPQLTDLQAEATLRFPGDRRLHLEASFLASEPSTHVSRYTLIGSAGTVVATGSWAMNGGGSVLLCDGAGRRLICAPDADPYAEQYRQFAACLDGAPVPEQISIERGLRDLTVLATLARSAASSGRCMPLTSAEDL
jgi:predicted dehydrogenase